MRGEEAGLAAAYGGLLAFASAFLLVQRVEQASAAAERDPKFGAYALYFGAIQRFVLVLGGLMLGFGVFELSPLPLLITFGVAQLAHVITAGRDNLRGS